MIPLKQVKTAFTKLAVSCTKRNPHKVHDYYLNTKVYVVKNAVVILTVCAKHVPH